MPPFSGVPGNVHIPVDMLMTRRSWAAGKKIHVPAETRARVRAHVAEDFKAKPGTLQSDQHPGSFGELDRCAATNQTEKSHVEHRRQ